MVGSGMAERYHRRIWNAVPPPDGVRIASRTDDWCGFNVAGPKSRDLLQRLTNADFVRTMPFPSCAPWRLTMAGVEAVALRVSFTGVIWGWEVYVPESEQLALFDALFEAGADLGVVPVGGRSLLSLRVGEGDTVSWGREYSPEYWPQEVGLDRLIKIGQAGLSRPRGLFGHQGPDAPRKAGHACGGSGYGRRVGRRARVHGRTAPRSAGSAPAPMAIRSTCLWPLHSSRRPM